MRRRVIIFVGLMVITSLGVWSQETTEGNADAKKKSTKRSVRFLPVGEAPPFRQEIREGVRYELAPPEGSLPPRTVIVSLAESKTEQLDLRLRTISRKIEIAEGERPLVLRDEDQGKEAAPWHAISLPETGDALAVLWRDAKKGSWAKANSVVLRYDRDFVPAGTVFFVNVSPVILKVILGKKRFTLEPGESARKKVGVVVGEPLQIGYLQKDKIRTFYQAGLVQNRGERSTMVIYLADGEKPRRPLQVTVLREKVP